MELNSGFKGLISSAEKDFKRIYFLKNQRMLLLISVRQISGIQA